MSFKYTLRFSAIGIERAESPVINTPNKTELMRRKVLFQYIKNSGEKVNQTPMKRANHSGQTFNFLSEIIDVITTQLPIMTKFHITTLMSFDPNPQLTLQGIEKIHIPMAKISQFSHFASFINTLLQFLLLDSTIRYCKREAEKNLPYLNVLGGFPWSEPSSTGRSFIENKSIKLRNVFLLNSREWGR